MDMDAETFGSILDAVARGGFVCDERDKRGVTRHYWDKYLETCSSAQAAYLRAQEERAQYFADRSLQILIGENREPDTNRARAASQNMQWQAAKLKPQTFGERIDVNVTHELGLRLAMDSRLRPIRDQRNVIDAQVIEDEALSEPQVTGSLPAPALQQDASDSPVEPIALSIADIL